MTIFDTVYDTVRDIADQNLCTQCGTCVALCPVHAIEMKLDSMKGLYTPDVDFDLCTSCRLCVKVCPGHDVNFPLLNRRIFGLDGEDQYLTNFLDCYAGHAADKQVRHQSSSGGMVTALLIHLLETGRIDGALVTRTVPEHPLRPVPFIARTRADIIASARSKYCPVPANVALGAIRQTPGKYAVVGLSCHMEGIRKAAEFDDALRERIVLHVGLFCGHSLSFTATEYLLRQYDIAPENVRRIEYRGGGWPGGIRVYTKDEKKIFIPHFEAWKLFDVAFTPWRCLLCRDGSAELADISFGDAWLDEFSGDPEGISAIVIRTPAGDTAFRSLVKARGAAVKAIESERIAASQQYFVTKNVYPTLYRVCGFMAGMELPRYEVDTGFPGPEDIINAMVRLLGCLLSARPWTRKHLLPFLTDEIVPFLSYLKSLPSMVIRFLKACLTRVRR